MGLILFLRMWVTFLLVVNSDAQRPVTTMPWNAFPETVIDYVLVDPPSTCMCKVMCILNSSCTAVSLYVNEGTVTCSFSNVAIDLASLSVSAYDHTFIYNVSQPTADSTSLLGTGGASTTSASITSGSNSSVSTSSGSTSSASNSSVSTSSDSTSSGSTSSVSNSSVSNSSASTSSDSTSSASTSSASNSSASTSSDSTSSGSTSSDSTTPASTPTAATTGSTSETTTTSASTTSDPSATTTTFSSTSSSTSSTTTSTTTSTTSTTTTTTPTVTNCNLLYWSVFNGSCYLHYTIFALTWQGAENKCVYYSSHLVQISSPEELAFIENRFSSTASWIGMRKDSTGTFKWAADNSASVLSNWDSNEPSSGDCVYMSNGKWKTKNCGDYLVFFCKKPAY